MLSFPDHNQTDIASLRNRLVPVVFKVAAFPLRQRELRNAFPLGLIKLPPWLREGLETPDDVINPQHPAAALAMLKMGLGIGLMDDHNISHNAMHHGGYPHKMKRQEVFDCYRSSLQDAIAQDTRMTGEMQTLTAAVERITFLRFREICESNNIYLRAAAYEWSRRRLSPDKPWTQTTREDREVIAAEVLMELYTKTHRTFWATAADDPEHPVPLKDDISENVILSLMEAEISCIATEGSGVRLPRNWWVAKVDRSESGLLLHKGHGGAHRRKPPHRWYYKSPSNSVAAIPTQDVFHINDTSANTMEKEQIEQMGIIQGKEGKVHAYKISDVAWFLKSKEQWGGFSNMAGDFPLSINGHAIRTSEALYQSCKFPLSPETQELLFAQKSPITLARIARAKARPPREDWDEVKLDVMNWVLRIKLLQNWEAFGKLLRDTGDLMIVERSRRDTFWGAVLSIDEETLVGQNHLGLLLVNLRHQLLTTPDALLTVAPPNISGFLILDEPVREIRREEDGSHQHSHL